MSDDRPLLIEALAWGAQILAAILLVPVGVFVGWVFGVWWPVAIALVWVTAFSSARQAEWAFGQAKAAAKVMDDLGRGASYGLIPASWLGPARWYTAHLSWFVAAPWWLLLAGLLVWRLRWWAPALLPFGVWLLVRRARNR